MKRSCLALAWISLLALAIESHAAAVKLINSGSDAGKLVIAVLGDGYNAAQQAQYAADVDNLLIKGLFEKDFFKENRGAFNLYRIDLVSVDGEVSTRTWDERGTVDPADDVIISNTPRNTALKYIYNGINSHCWMEGSPDTRNLVDNAVAADAPAADYILVILNTNGFGGCGGGGYQAVTRSVDWSTVAHEFGHGIGDLHDEYVAARAWGGEPINGINCSNRPDRGFIYWRRFVHPNTPMPTAFVAGMDANRTVGAFEGCGTYSTGIYRPVEDCRMRTNWPNYCPVCYTHMKRLVYPASGHSFHKSFPFDFSGDGLADLVVKQGKSLHLFKNGGGPAILNPPLEPIKVYNISVPFGTGAPGTGWLIGTNDQFYPGDFDSDGKTDLYVSNFLDYPTPRLAMLQSTGTGFQPIMVFSGNILNAWTLSGKDRYQVADFNDDRKADLLISQGSTTSRKVAIFNSTGTNLATLMSQKTAWGTWTAKPSDQYYLGDFDNDGKTDMFAHNVSDWGGTKYFAMCKFTGSTFSVTKKFTNKLPVWNLGTADIVHVGDFNGDKKADLYISNDGSDWGGTPYLGMFRSTGTDLAMENWWDNNDGVPGYGVGRGDRYFVADANKDGKDDLFVWNPKVDWGHYYLGTLLSNGTSLTGSWSENWVGDWIFSSTDIIQPVRYEGTSGKSGIFIRNAENFGLIRRTFTGLTLDRYYYKWMYPALYDAYPWSDGFP